MAALLLVILMAFCGCGTAADPAGTAPEPAETAAPTPTLRPEEEAEQQERRARLDAQMDGFLLDKGYLYAVDEDGGLLRDTYVGVLYFREDGRYTSGSEDLDRLVAGVIRKNTDEKMSRMELLRAMYLYTRDNIKYVGFGNHEDSYKPAHGADGWMVECATYALENGKGNCYHFASTFAALARGVGFQAYAASGLIGSEETGIRPVLQAEGRDRQRNGHRLSGTDGSVRGGTEGSRRTGASAAVAGTEGISVPEARRQETRPAPKHSG